MMTLVTVLILLIPYSSSAFQIYSASRKSNLSPLCRQQHVSPFKINHAKALCLSMANDDDGNDELPSEPTPKVSRIEGNIRAPSAKEISIIDDMITKLSNAKPYELPSVVSKSIRVVSSPRFFLRIAERADMEKDPAEKEKLATLAENLTTTISAVVSTTEDKLDDRAKSVEDVLKCAAEPDTGDFLVPLSTYRIDAMRDKMNNFEPDVLDEGFLSTIDSWMNKSQQDGMDGMVGILQKVLQMYAGIAISRARLELKLNVGAAVSNEGKSKADKMLAEKEAAGSNNAAVFMERLMKVDADLWDGELLGAFQREEIKPMSIISEVQRTIEAVVLGLENGSMAQRVQAEFLKELVTRIEIVEKKV